MSALLLPRQLYIGFKVKGGIEAAVHSARLYLNQMPSSNALLKFDFKNAFNSLHRKKCYNLWEIIVPISIHLFTPPIQQDLYYDIDTWFGFPGDRKQQKYLLCENSIAYDNYIKHQKKINITKHSREYMLEIYHLAVFFEVHPVTVMFYTPRGRAAIRNPWP